MTREEARKILGEGATEEQINNLLTNYHVDESSKIKELEAKINTLKNDNSKYSDYDEIKKQLDDINKANMTEQEKLEEMKKEIEKNLKDSRITKNEAIARKILAETNISENLLARLIDEDEQTTINNANEYLNSYNSIKDEVAKKTKEDLTTLNINPSISNVNQNENAMTFDKFRTLSVDEQNKFAEEHPEEFENL